MRPWIIIAALNGFFAVILGAMGAHALEPYLDAVGKENFQTANQYHMWHSIMMFGISIFWQHNHSRLLKFATQSFLAGIILFSGNLYWASISKDIPFHFLIPIGGMFFIVGWLFILLSAVKMKRN